MKRYTPAELAEVLRLHQRWLGDEEGGVRAYLAGANLAGANRISALAVFSGLYEYQCWAVVTVTGVAWVRMGCHLKPVEEWDAIGIRVSNPKEYPETAPRRANAVSALLNSPVPRPYGSQGRFDHKSQPPQRRVLYEP
jgi:hypothetical protein